MTRKRKKKNDVYCVSYYTVYILFKFIWSRREKIEQYISNSPYKSERINVVENKRNQGKAAVEVMLL